MFEYYPETGEYRYKRHIFGTAKGNGKTPFEGAIGAEGMLGPTAPPTPLVLVAASALDQSNLVFGDLKLGLTHDDCPYKPLVVPLELSIQFADGSPGEIKRVAAVAGSNDGPRATRLLCDELHEWTGRLGNVFDVLDGAIGKRQNAFTTVISTAGTDKKSKLGTMYTRGMAIAKGELIDDQTLFEWYEAPDELAEKVPEVIESPEDYENWLTAVLWANPALAEKAGFLFENYIRSRFDGAQMIERWKWFRYHLNRWTRSIKRWLPAGKWESCKRLRILRPREKAILVFSGTYDRDSAGLLAVLEDGFIVRLGSWEPPEEDQPEGALLYEVPSNEVQIAIKQAFENFQVTQFVVNPNGWHGEASDWVDKFGDRIVVVFDWTHQIRRKHDACSKFFTAVVTGAVGHDGDSHITRHLDSASQKETSEGAWITKGDRNGPPIDLAVCAVMGYDLIGAEPEEVGELVSF